MPDRMLACQYLLIPQHETESNSNRTSADISVMTNNPPLSLSGIHVGDFVVKAGEVESFIGTIVGSLTIEEDGAVQIAGVIAGRVVNRGGALFFAGVCTSELPSGGTLVVAVGSVFLVAGEFVQLRHDGSLITPVSPDSLDLDLTPTGAQFELTPDGGVIPWEWSGDSVQESSP